MKTFTATVAVLSVVLPSAFAQQSVSVSYDQAFDVAGTSLNTVSCSDGKYGLEKKYHTFGGIPNFAHIGGAPTIPGWNSPNCGKCYQLTYEGKSIFVTAIDAAPGGFNLALAAMNDLTDGNAVDLGRVQATYTEVAASNCGM
ncbi:Cerato-platanin [Aspergillus ambiguus]|uniref:allergenic cerato-platanin Asp F13 n=1 Tax=Aspergillus ambiguus TaxID=176160 RepID=UPI003CCD6C43